VIATATAAAVKRGVAPGAGKTASSRKPDARRKKESRNGIVVSGSNAQ